MYCNLSLINDFIYAWLSAPDQSYDVRAINGYENAAGSRIAALGVVLHAYVAQNMATGSQGEAMDQAWSVTSGTNICDISTDELSDGPIAIDSSTAETIKNVLPVYLP
jgi:hypothetical protein